MQVTSRNIDPYDLVVLFKRLDPVTKYLLKKLECDEGLGTSIRKVDLSYRKDAQWIEESVRRRCAEGGLRICESTALPLFLHRKTGQVLSGDIHDYETLRRWATGGAQQHPSSAEERALMQIFKRKEVFTLPELFSGLLVSILWTPLFHSVLPPKSRSNLQLVQLLKHKMDRTPIKWAQLSRLNDFLHNIRITIPLIPFRAWLRVTNNSNDEISRNKYRAILEPNTDTQNDDVNINIFEKIMSKLQLENSLVGIYVPMVFRKYLEIMNT